MSEDPVGKAVQRSVGIATLRRLHRMIAAEHVQRAVEQRWARRLAWAFLAAALLAVAGLAFR